MATQVEHLPGCGNRRSHDSYPWDDWLDGRAWYLRRGEDFAVAVRAMRAYVYRAAHHRGVAAQTRRDGEQGLYVQAILDETAEVAA